MLEATCSEFLNSVFAKFSINTQTFNLSVKSHEQDRNNLSLERKLAFFSGMISFPEC